MRILVIDGQGGKLGGQLIGAVKKQFTQAHVIAVGTNSIATSSMLKAGADEGATGENPVVVCSADADVIMGPIGIVISNSLMGEVTERMALAISSSPAARILIPTNRCDNLVAGVNAQSMSELIEDAIAKIEQIK